MRLITRLRMKGLWLKHAYRFLWAHKPLCDKFAEDVLMLGPVFLCRSCTCAYGGIVSGLLLIFLAPLSVGILPVLFLSALCGVLGFSAPPLYKRLPRFVRDILRFTSGALIPLSVYLCTRPGFWIGAFGLAVLFAFWVVYFRVRKARKLKECDGCPELEANKICSGFAMQAGHVRRFEQEATELLIHSDYVPECLNSSVKGKAGER